MGKKKKDEVEINLESVTAKVQGVGDIPEVDLNNLVPEPIKPLKDDKTVPEQTETVFIYCGPPNKFVSRYTGFKNGYPVHLVEHIKKFPVLKSLFVEPEHFQEFELNVSQPGTVENIWFEKAKEYFSKAVK